MGSEASKFKNVSTCWLDPPGLPALGENPNLSQDMQSLLQAST